MPLYEYQCEQCSDTFEVIQKFADKPLTVHEKCGGHVHRLISAPALRFKGSGWYVTDYAKGSGSNGSSGSHTNGHASSSESTPAKTEKPVTTSPASTSSTSSSDKT